MPSDTLSAADGRWPSILQDLAGLHPDQLKNRHQPCPNCQGTDRYRWRGDDGPGSWFCSHCGGRDGKGGGGTGIGLLMRVRNWDFVTAIRAVEQHLGITPGTPSHKAPSPAPAAAPRKPKRPARIPDKPPVDAPPPALDGATHQWCYRNAAGEQLFWIQRVPRPGTDSKGKPNKLYIHRTWINSAWHRPSKRDAFTSEWPSPRPLYRLEQLQLHPEAGVLLTEGEKAADAAARFFPQAVCLSWPNGGKAIKHVDWTPLAGRSITLWPDNDDEGRQAMASLATMLLQSGAAKVAIVTPPPDRPPGWDLADASDWSSSDANAWVRQHRSAPITLPEPPAPPTEPEPPSQEPPAAVRKVPTDRPFECLGFDIDGFYYQPHRTGQVVRLARSSHTGTNLVALAPISYWESVYPSKTGANWTAAASDLFEEQASIGMFDSERLRGRGAWLDDGRSVLHLGDRLIVEGETMRITRRLPGAFHYQLAPRLHGPGKAEPLSDPEAYEILNLAERFRWESKSSGTLLAGWIVLAPISGQLSWRPHVWMFAGPGSGKSELLRRFLYPLLSDIRLGVKGNTTEACIRQALRCDALPVIFDEAEPNNHADALRIQSILDLARCASSDSDDFIGKGSAGGEAQRFRPRSMFLLCSINTAIYQGADRRRFAQLCIQSPSAVSFDERRSHWETLERELDRVVSPEIGRRLIARTVALLPVIREAIKVFRRVAAQHFDSQPLGDQYGTLLAGAWSLQSSEVPSEAEAKAMLREGDWSSYQQTVEIPDERRCIQTILERQLRVETEHLNVTRTVAELVEAANGLLMPGGDPVSKDVATATLGRHGIRVDQGRVTVSNSSTQLAKFLADTPWARCWPQTLARLPGAAVTRNTVRFKGMGSTRAVEIPIETIRNEI